MLKDKLLFGQYYPAESLIHRLNAAAKIPAALIYMISLFIVDNWYGWGVLAVLALICTAVSRLPLVSLWRGMKVIAILCAFTFLLNLFFYPGDALLEIGFIKISRQGLFYGLAMAVRLLLLVLFGSLLTLTTKPMELCDGMEKLLTPFAKVGVPAHSIAMMISIALRFIPTILEEFDRIMLAQRARGAVLNRGRLTARIRAFVPMLIPLFVSAFRRAEELAVAMEAKCYRGGKGRSKWRVAPWQLCDTLVLLFFCALFAGSILYRIMS